MNKIASTSNKRKRKPISRRGFLSILFIFCSCVFICVYNSSGDLIDFAKLKGSFFSKNYYLESGNRYTIMCRGDRKDSKTKYAMRITLSNELGNISTPYITYKRRITRSGHPIFTKVTSFDIKKTGSYRLDVVILSVNGNKTRPFYLQLKKNMWEFADGCPPYVVLPILPIALAYLIDKILIKINRQSTQC